MSAQLVWRARARWASECAHSTQDKDEETMKLLTEKDEQNQKKDKEAQRLRKKDGQMLATRRRGQEKYEELARLRAQVAAPVEGVPDV